MTGIRHRRSRPRPWLAPLIGAAALLTLWQVAATSGLREKGVLASPTSIVAELFSAPLTYLGATGATLGYAAAGYVIGQVAAVVLAVLFVQIRALEKLFLQLALAIVCVPLVAVMPILQIAFDPNSTRVILAAISVFFPTLISTLVGLRTVDRTLLVLMRSWGASSWQVLGGIRLPSALPGIFTGLQIGVPAALLGALLAEFSGAESGLGTLIVTGLFKMNVEMTWTVAVIATVLTTALYAVVARIGRALVPWQSGITATHAEVSAAPWWRRALASTAWSVAAVGVVLLAWWAFIAVFRLSPFFAKGPLEVFAYLFTDADAAAHRALLWEPLGVTLQHAGVGYIAGLLLGLVAATLFVAFPTLERVLLPVTMALRSMPLPVLLPVIIIAFGRDLLGVTVLCAIVTFFPTLTNVSSGLARTPRDALLLFQSYSSPWPTTYLRARFPFAMPSVLASARIAAPSALLAATLAEWLATGNGLGAVMVTARATQQFALLWSSAVLLTTVAVAFYLLVSSGERAVLRRFGVA